MAKVLPFARKPASANPALDVCLAKGRTSRRYVIAEVRSDVWECSIDEDGRVSRVALSRREAVQRKAELELRIATELGAGWTLERNR
ncbi:MAG: hypothetical protein ACM3NQ_22580 [Bacteroidales bacterium]